ncbi:class I SAM-dependent methyltransferase [Mameliella sp. CS4]|uniref:SAM-dependent methyltransferase n=1 Tax=Mameliella sp. CS4 TaxID=2862329 RepID=UPI001C5D8A47|nr:class I SAM-dependent methyltransferase [Mameliella sp. CS4]MBW4984009.1 class I SAM-dependent methyltransferase [Mameliella sp. CS4]
MDWNTRFDTSDYVFGTAPSGFLTAHTGLIPPGARTLCIADGEGRNSVWLAQQGCDVTAFDLSPNAIAKAEKLARSAGVSPDFNVSTIEGWDWSQTYDLVVAVFFQFLSPEERTPVFAGLRRALAPGGRLMLHGYTPKQVEYGTGGPGDPANMYTADMLRDAFPDLTLLRLAEYEQELNEGAGHKGRSALVDLIGDAPR